uniref:EGF-like domain-containing protein n=1 Tax=Ciona savignyi TaxID=51511 RepID=H2YJN0_CIOSA
MLRLIILCTLAISHRSSAQTSCYPGKECIPGYYCDSAGYCRPLVSNSQPSNAAAACNPNPCQGDCTCVPSCRHASGYYCSSTAGYLGKTCNIPAPNLVCGTNTITIRVPERFVREYDPTLAQSYIYMGPSYDSAPTSSANSPCIARAPVNGFYTISIPLPFTACQTTNQPRARIDSSNVFTNKVWLNRNGALFDIPVPVITWSCTYTEKYSIVTSLQPAVDPIRNQLSGVIQRQATVELCKVGNACPNACPPMFTVNSGAVYTVSEVIHLTLTVPRPPTQRSVGQIVILVV